MFSNAFSSSTVLSLPPVWRSTSSAKVIFMMAWINKTLRAVSQSGGREKKLRVNGEENETRIPQGQISCLSPSDQKARKDKGTKWTFVYILYLQCYGKIILSCLSALITLLSVKYKTKRQKDVNLLFCLIWIETHKKEKDCTTLDCTNSTLTNKALIGKK